MTNAYQAVREQNMPMLRASKQFGVPQTSLCDRVLSKVDPETVTMGKAPLFSNLEEANIVEHIKKMANYGYGYSRHELAGIAHDYAMQVGKRSKNNPVTIRWVDGFLGRWPELHVLKPRSLEQIRAKMTSEMIVNNYFEELQTVMKKYNLTDKPHMIYNVDEKPISQNHKPPHVVASSLFHPPAVTAGRSNTTTVLGCGSAAGITVPPYFVFPGKRMLPELMNGASPGADGSVSDSGWSNSIVFRNYLEDHFLKYVPSHSDQKILLLLDGHKTHVSVGLVEWANERGIILFILPAHTSHFLQPMDVACFGPFQRIYDSLCHSFTRETSGTITRYNICELACRAYTRALSAENLQSSFKRTGIYPLNKEAIPKESLIPAELYEFEKQKEPDDGNDSDATVEGGIVSEMESTPDVNDCHKVQVDSENFFQNKENDLRRVKSEITKKPRKTMSKIVSGRAITRDKITNLMREHEKEQNKSKAPKKRELKGSNSSKLTKEKVLTKKCKKTETVDKSKKKSNTSEPTPGPSHIAVDSDNYSDTDSNFSADLSPEKLCCVCKKYRPKEIRHCASLMIAKWGYFDGFNNGWPCKHSTHLGFCSSVKFLRRGDKFYCPHCAPPTEE